MSLILKQMKVQLHTRALSLFSFLLLLTQPAIFSVIGFFLARAAGRTSPDLFYTVMGSGIMGLWSSVLFTSFFDIRADRREGVLELVVGSPTPLLTTLSIRTLTNVLVGAIALSISIVLVASIFHFVPPLENIWLILISMLILLVAFWCLGLFLVHWQAMSRLSSYVVNYLELPLTIFAGFLFPSELLPVWAQWIGSVLPVSWALKALKVAYQPGTGLSTLMTYWGLSIGISCIVFIITVAMSKQVNRMIRVTGELSSI